MAENKKYVDLDALVFYDQLIKSYFAKKDDVDLMVKTAVAAADNLKRKIVFELPTTDIDEHTIYMLHADPDSGSNKFSEWMYIGGVWEKIGDLDIDSSGYAKTEDLVSITSSEISKLLNG